MGEGTPSEDLDIEVVIVSYQSRELVIDCIRSLETYVPDSISVLIHVVDNASSDGTVEAIRSLFPKVLVHARATNDGFSVANNVALRLVHAPFVLALNPDTRFVSDALTPLLRRMREEPDLGLLGCRLEKLDGSFDHASKRSFPSPIDALHHFASNLGVGTDQLEYRAPSVDERGSGDVDAVNGAFMLMRSQAVAEAGYFDEGYWMYGEDLDLCKEIALSGWRVAYDGTVSVVHVKGGVAGRWRNTKLIWHFHRSMARFYRKYDAGKRPLLDPAVYGVIWARCVAMIGISAVQRKVRPAIHRLVGRGMA